MAFRNRSFNPLTTESEWKIYSKKSGKGKRLNPRELDVIVRAIGKNGVKSTKIEEDHVSFVLSYTIRRENFIKKFGQFGELIDLVSAFSSLNRDDQLLFDQLAKTVGFVPIEPKYAEASTSKPSQPSRKRKRFDPEEGLANHSSHDVAEEEKNESSDEESSVSRR